MELADTQKIGDLLAAEAHAAFFWAVSQGYLEVLKELLRRGADVAQPSPLRTLEAMQGKTALAVAVLGLRKAEVQLLLKYGAWDKEPEPRRQLLLSWAQERKPIAEAFREAGVGNFSPILAPLTLPYKQHGIWDSHSQVGRQTTPARVPSNHCKVEEI